MLKNMADPHLQSDAEEAYYGPSVAPAALEVWAEIKRLGLGEHVGELETLGYTVIPPEKVASPEFIARIREKILDVAEKRSGIRPEIGRPDSGMDPQSAFGDLHFGLVMEDPLFEKAVQNPTVLAMVTYLLGRSAVLTTATSIIKGAGEVPLALHTDLTRMAPPFPSHPQMANATWIFTDYDLDNGSICFVPGSHRHCRPPMPQEGYEHRQPVKAPAGSLILHTSHTWHGAFPRTTPGLRVCISMTYCRPYIKPYETLRETVTEDMLARNPPRFATLMGQDIAISFGAEGPDPRYGAESHMIGRHVYD